MKDRKAFTVMELIVVSVIFAILFGLTIRNSGDGRTVKGAAQEFAGILRNAKSKALCKESGAGIILQTEANNGIVVHDAYILPFIECKVDKMPKPVRDSYPTSIDIGLNILNASPDELKLGYKVKFYSTSPPNSTNARGLYMSEWYSFSYVNPPTATISFNSDNGQTSRNSYWHPLIDCGGLDNSQTKKDVIAGVARCPTKSGIAMTFPKVATIDLRYSGSGNDVNTKWGNLDNKGSLGIVFDILGGLDAIVKQNPTEYIDPCEIVYFFIVDRKEFVQDKRLSSENAFWVAIHPNSGQVSVSSHIPQDSNDTNALIAGRENARKSLSIGK